MSINHERNLAQIWKNIFDGTINLANALEEARKAAQIRQVSINCAPSCNLRCKHCFYGYDDPHRDLLTDHEWQSVIRSFIDLGVRHFHLSGKEPLAAAMTFNILDYLRENAGPYNINYGIITNGTLIERAISKLRRSDLGYLDISLDGDEYSNDFLRGKGVFAEVVKNLKLAIENRVAKRFYVSSVAHRANIDGLARMIVEVSRSTGVKDFFVQPLQIHGKAMALLNLALNPESYGELVELVRDSIAENPPDRPIRVVFFVPQYYLPRMYDQNEMVRRSLTQYFEVNRTGLKYGQSEIAFRFHLTCLAFWRTVQITPDGYYIGCSVPLSSKRYYEYAIGNVKEESVRSLYEKSISAGSILDNAYDYRNVSKCAEKSCFRKCLGGCRVLSHIQGASWSSVYNLCPELGDEARPDQTPRE